MSVLALMLFMVNSGDGFGKSTGIGLASTECITSTRPYMMHDEVYDKSKELLQHGCMCSKGNLGSGHSFCAISLLLSVYQVGFWETISALLGHLVLDPQPAPEQTDAPPPVLLSKQHVQTLS